MNKVIAGLLFLVAGCNAGRTSGVDPVADDSEGGGPDQCQQQPRLSGGSLRGGTGN
jgi:hypothetical protein